MKRALSVVLRHEASLPREVGVSSVWRRRELLGWLDEGPLGFRTKCRCCHRLQGFWLPSKDEALAALDRHQNPQQVLEVA